LFGNSFQGLCELFVGKIDINHSWCRKTVGKVIG